MSYIFSQLLPKRASGAHAHNAPLLGPMSFGIEVTESALAQQCQLGNLDPQHSPGGSGEAAVSAALTCKLPPRGTRLVTIKSDMDALGAMAVLSMRLEGVELSDTIISRVSLIARADSFDIGPWPGPQPPPASDAEWLDFVAGPFGVAPISMLAMDEKLPLNTRVKAIEGWLKNGEMPFKHKNAVKDHAEHIAAAYANGDILLSVPIEGKLALLVTKETDTLRLGYYPAPVVLAIAASPRMIDAGCRKITVAQYSPGILDLRSLSDTLNFEEPGWGGSPTIIGSPQGVGSAIPVARLIALIEALSLDHSSQ